MKENPIGTLIAIAAVAGFAYFVYTRIRASRNKPPSDGLSGGDGSGRNTKHK